MSNISEKLSVSPWPEGTGPVVFLLDASIHTEQLMLEHWIESHRPAGASATLVNLSLWDDRTPLQVHSLANILTTDATITVAPLRVAWMPSAKAIESGVRARDLIFGNERRPGDARARYILNRHPEKVHLINGLPATIEEMGERFESKYHSAPGDRDDKFAVFVAKQAAIVLDMAERRLRGGRYKVPRYVAQSLRNNREFNARLDDIAHDEGRERPDIDRELSEYLHEMVSIPTPFWMDVWIKFCSVCLGLGYEKSLNYRQEDLERIRGMVRDYPSALLWTHKTYIDGFVVPKICFDNDFPLPHFFGGANLNIPLLGFLVRRSGGIFIKRTFSDNEVYKVTMRQYIGYLMEKRFPLSWSFEGTRSRLGKLMPPKYGVLKYVLEGCYNAGARDVHIIPVSVSYDLIRDAEEYAREQSGVPKAPESLSWLIGYIRSLARPMGKIYVDFGEPVVLPEAPDPDDRLALSKVAFQVAVEVNRVTPITFPAVISMALLGVYPRALTEEEVSHEVEDIVRWARARGHSMSPDFDRQYAEGIEPLLNLMISENVLTRFTGGPSTVYGIAPGRAAVASYYRNIIVHFFINKAIIEIALIGVTEMASADENGLALFWQQVDELRDLFKFEFFYPPTEVFHEDIRTELGRATYDWESQLAEGATGARRLLLSSGPLFAHRSLQMFAEGYSLGAELLASLRSDESIDEAEFVERSMNYGRQALLQRRLTCEASMGKLLFANTWKMLASRGLTEGTGDALVAERGEQAAALRTVVRRIEVGRATAIGQRGITTLRESTRAHI